MQRYKTEFPRTFIAAASIASALWISAATVATASEPTHYNWTGPYAGINAGYGWSDTSIGFTGDDPAGNAGAGNLILNFMKTGSSSDATYRKHSYSANTGGFVGGAHVGFNWRLSRHWIVGLEADLQKAEVDGAASTDQTLTQGLSSADFRLTGKNKLEWFGSARARVGYLTGNRILLYGTAGLAYGRTDADATFGYTAGTPGASISGGTTNMTDCSGPECLAGASAGTSVGWIAGAGFEWALTDTVSLKTEYLHIDLGSETVRMVTRAPTLGDAFIDAKFKNAFDIVRVGLNVRF
jgi:outer membrane immunogenic protein